MRPLRPSRRGGRNRRRVDGRRGRLSGGGSESLQGFGCRAANHGALLPDVEPGPDEAKRADLASKPEQIACGNRAAVMSTQACVKQVEIGQQLIGRLEGTRLSLE